MRLLNVNTLKVVGFAGCAPAYAILSHNWDDEEVTLYQLDDLGAASRLKGFRKLKNACNIAKGDGYEWIWIDTCCIDKTSSAELSEAINSMFPWYQQAEICYAHISDVSDVEFRQAVDSRTPYFPQCRWLTRGWTLQELIAPQELRFYSQNWKMVGSKASFSEILSHATQIPPDVLKAGDVSRITICEKMRWIASRETTRPEDVAYCVLGIFDINMPLLYGEGREKAFRRLQEEILRVSDDPTIFLWTADHDEPNHFWGLLARLPSQFKSTPMGIEGLNSIANVSDSSIVITSQGLEVSWQVAPVRDDPSHALLVVFLARKKRIMYAILLQQMDYAGFKFARVAAHTKIHVVITGGGRQATLCPAGPHDATHFPLQRIHPGDTRLKRFSVKQDPIPRNRLTKEVAVGFSFNISMHNQFKVEQMEWDELPELGFEAFYSQENLLFHRFIKNGIDLESKTGKHRIILAALNLKVKVTQFFDAEECWSEPFYMVLAISPVSPSSIGTVAPFVRPQAFFPPEEYRSKPLQNWLVSHISGATFWTDSMTVRAGRFKVTVQCSFAPNMLPAEPYYGIVLSATEEEVEKRPTPKFSFSNTQPNSFFSNTKPNSSNSSSSNTEPNSSSSNTQPNSSSSNTQPESSSSNTQPNSPFSNTQPNSSPPNTQPFSSSSKAQPNSPFSIRPNSFFSNTQPFSSSSNAQPNSPFSNTQPFSPFSNTQPFSPFSNTQPNSLFSNTQPNSPFSNTQPFSSFSNTQPFSSSGFNTSTSSDAPTFPSFLNTTPNAGPPSFSFPNRSSNTAASHSSEPLFKSDIGNTTATGRPDIFGSGFRNVDGVSQDRQQYKPESKTS